MKWSIEINQRAIIENEFDLDLVDVAIFDIIKDFSCSQTCRKTVENGHVYFWISWKLIVDQGPILNLKTRQSVYLRVEKLIKCELLERHPQNKVLSQSWFCFGKNYDKMIGSTTIQPIEVPKTPVNDSLQVDKYPLKRAEHPVNENLQVAKTPVNENLQGVNNDLQVSDSTCKPSFTGPVNENLQNTGSIKDNVIFSSSTSTNARENEKNRDWRFAGKEEMKIVIEGDKNNPPQNSGSSPPYNWSNLSQVLLSDSTFVEWARFTLKIKADALEDLILEYIVFQNGINRPLNRDYQDLKQHIVNFGRKHLADNGNNSTKNNFRNSKTGGQTAIIPRDDDY